MQCAQENISEISNDVVGVHRSSIKQTEVNQKVITLTHRCKLAQLGRDQGSKHLLLNNRDLQESTSEICKTTRSKLNRNSCASLHQDGNLLTDIA